MPPAANSSHSLPVLSPSRLPPAVIPSAARRLRPGCFYGTRNRSLTKPANKQWVQSQHSHQLLSVIPSATRNPELKKPALTLCFNSKRNIISFAFLFATLAFLSGCARSHPAENSGTVNFLIESMPANLDPRIGTDAQSQRLDSLIFSSLVWRDAQMNPVPDLAERWETPDPRTYVFHLRRGVRFHDGRPLTAIDVKYTFDSIIAGAIKTPKRGSFRIVDSIAAPDESTIIFHLREPYASFLGALMRPAIGIVPRDSGPEIAQHPIGSGPFRFVSSLQDEDVVLERNPDYFGAAPKIARVRFRIVPDPMTRALELRKGTADIAINSLSSDTVVALASDRGLEVTESPGTSLAYIAINFDDSILAHREVRQALAYATDRATLIRYLLRDQARPAYNLLPPNSWAFDPDVPHYDYDPARARKLLDAAGFPPGADGIRFHLTLKTSTEESPRLLAAALQDQWKQVGIALELRPLEIATLFADITRGSFQLYTLRWIGANNDPDIFEFVFSSQKIPPNGANRGRYRNPQLDALLDQARSEMDQQKRLQIFSQIQKIVANDLPYLNLWYIDNVCVHRRRIGNVSLLPSGDYDFIDSIVLQ
jgi:peptide/nickel transport system substrate-binding protein